MRVLWFSVTPSLFNPHTNGHNGGGWISSLESIVRTMPEIKLGVAFNFSKVSDYKYENDNVVYYPIPQHRQSHIQRLLKSDDTQAKIAQYIDIIEDFKPDIIQIFGSENDFGLICDKVSIPTVIHMQGSIPPYYNALFPIGMNNFDFIFGRGLSIRNRYVGLRSEPSFRKRAGQEISVIKSCRFFMGRTGWDKNIVSLLNPSATYFHCEEALRDSFIKNLHPWKYQNREKAKIISVISTPWYKGVDLILKTAQLLKKHTPLNFEWNIYGVKDIRFYEQKYKIKASEVNVNLMGSASKDVIAAELADSSCYVHTSYIDNSPNSLCEAQIIGIPVLATFVGGIPSLVKDGCGLLYPANDPFSLSGLIRRIVSDEKLALKISAAEISAAKQRHDPQQIGQSLLQIYNQILSYASKGSSINN